jgi:hypothetical protein
VRLDHLLSKELLSDFGLTRAVLEPNAFETVCSWVEHLTRCSSNLEISVQFFGTRNGSEEGSCTCTLLGPEGPDLLLVE